MLKLVRKYLGSRKVQSISIIVSVVLSVAVVYALVLAYSGVSNGIATSEKRIGADIIAMPAGAQGSVDDSDILFTGAYANYYMDASIEDDIKTVPGVEATTVQFFSQMLSEEDCCTDGLQARIIGYDPETDWVIAPWLQETGRTSLASDEVYIGSKVIQESDGTLAVLGRTFTVKGVLDPTGTSFDQSILIDMDTARSLVADNASYAFLWDEYGQPEGLVTAVLVKVAEGKDVSAVAGMIAHRYGLDVIVSSDTLEGVIAQTSTVFNLMLAVSLLLVIASIVQLFGRFYTMVWDRKTEFGLYRALGSTKGDLRTMVLGEMAALVGVGTIVGLILGFVFYQIVAGAVLADTAFPYIAPEPLAMVGYAALVLVGMIVVGLLSIAVPLSQIGKISPMLSINKATVD